MILMCQFTRRLKSFVIKMIILSPLLLFVTTYCIAAAASSVEIDSNGSQRQSSHQQRPPSQLGPIKATFTNDLPDTHINLYWAGNYRSTKYPPGVLQLYYGPIPPNGGELTIEGYENQVFVLTETGSYKRVGRYRLGVSSKSKESTSSSEKFVVNERSANHHLGKFPPKSSESEEREKIAMKCRSMNDSNDDDDHEFNKEGSPFSKGFLDRCQKCANVDGCGFSPVRDNCFASHTVATINDVTECHDLDAAVDETKSVDDWLNKAIDLMIGIEEKEGAHSISSKPLRMAYKYVIRAGERLDQIMTIEADEADDNNKSVQEEASLASKKVKPIISELTAKLEAVFDDIDMMELISSSRHPKLEEIHPDMPAVPRRTVNEAKEYVLRAEPVVITNLFDNTATNPVVHRWTLEYLNEKVFGAAASVTNNNNNNDVPKFNVAADDSTRCCRYFEPQGNSLKAGYPYPFAPTTHLYRDTFDGFVNTIRNVPIEEQQAKDESTDNNNNATHYHPKTLHYLHEIVLNADGEAVVAGGPAPKHLREGLDSITTQLQPIASNQAFFGGFAYAKAWFGQRGIIMPIHYDATDNLYVMSWGRKRAIIGEPGQLNALYRYPNDHPLAGSSQVNLTEPNLDRYPHFTNSKLREVIVGPGDVLFLPAWWWHQFEQPFEDTAALNLWSRDTDHAPSGTLRDMRIREHVLHDQLEESITRLFGKDTGIILDALANNNESMESSSDVAILVDDQNKLKKAKDTLIAAAKSWKQDALQLPGGHPKMTKSPDELVGEYLDHTYRGIGVMMDAEGTEWHPGKGWDLSKISTLPHIDRCRDAPESTPFMSLCD